MSCWEVIASARILVRAVRKCMVSVCSRCACMGMSFWRKLREALLTNLACGEAALLTIMQRVLACMTALALSRACSEEPPSSLDLLF